MLVLFIFILGILLNFQLFGQIELKLKLLTSTNTFVYCEPIPVELSWENKGRERIMVYDRDPFDSPITKLVINGKEEEKHKPWMARVAKTPLVGAGFLSPGERVVRNIDFSGYRLSPGYYRIKFIGEFISNFEAGYRERIESDEIEFAIKEAIGEDLKAVEWAKEEYMKEKRKGNDYITECYKITSSEVLEKFPTSTYAGWVLARTSPGVYFADYANGKELIDDMLKPVEKRFISGVIAKCEGEKYKKLEKRPGECWKTIDYIAKEYIGYAEKFLSAKNEHIYMGEILSRIAMAHIILNNWEEAYKYLNKSIDVLKEIKENRLREESRYLKRMVEVKEELKLRGFIKNH